jgi:hypothetical protein
MTMVRQRQEQLPPKVLRELQDTFRRRNPQSHISHDEDVLHAVSATMLQPPKQPVGFWKVEKLAPYIFLVIVTMNLLATIFGGVEEGMSWTIMGPVGIILRNLFGFNLQTQLGL